MMNVSYSPWMSVGFGIHFLFAAITLMGAILFLVWAMKLKADELKKWFTWLLIIGVVGLLVSAPLGHFGSWGRHDRANGSMQKMMDTPQEMMKNEKMK